jgi:mono/diheme cytochrome c family protein
MNGYGRMPAWGGMSELTKIQLDQLASYLKHISTVKHSWQ